MAKDEKVEVGIFIRKPAPGQFSLEYLFKEIYEQLPPEMSATWLEAPYSSRGLWNRIKLIFWARRNSKKVNHVTGDIHFINLLLPRASNILTIHDCEFILRASGLKRWLLTWFWLKLPVGRSQVVTTISQDAKNDIIQLSGCSPEKVVVIPNFVSDAFKPGSDKKENGRFRVLHVGTKSNKNLERLIEASLNQNWELHIVGPLNENQREKLETGGVAYQNYVGVSQNQLIHLYQTSDVLFFASLKEGFGLPILEAQRCGLPVITSNMSSMPEVAGDGALLVDPYSISAIRNNINLVVNDQLLSEKLVQKGLDNVKRFSLERTVDRYLSLYQTVAS